MTNPFTVIFLKRYLNVIAIRGHIFLSGMEMLVTIPRSCTPTLILTNSVHTVTALCKLIISVRFVFQISRFPAGSGYNLQICVQEERQECGLFPSQFHSVEVI